KSFEEVAELKSRMYALLNHETRTPLHGILLPAQELRTNESLNAEERDMFLEMIEQSATRLQHLFERVDTLSTMKSGLWDFQFIATDVRKVVQSAIDAITARIPACDITLEHDLPEAVFAMLDPHQMSRVIAAMLENAIQFSPLEGRVTVGVRHDNEYCYVTVSDEGDGIDPVFLPHVFEEFGHPDGMHHTKGYGLSLATVRQVMLAHQGTIEVESTKGVGTTFTLRLSITSS
ncbi:MAG: HAMP domain-containing histidine kinase, partial [Candidatus Tectomicrobia bacterium]|nr:HAMP domain-containing histidine kinase [Candidatus Tectomicrobia bacterium]